MIFLFPPSPEAAERWLLKGLDSFVRDLDEENFFPLSSYVFPPRRPPAWVLFLVGAVRSQSVFFPLHWSEKEGGREVPTQNGRGGRKEWRGNHWQ